MPAEDTYLYRQIAETLRRQILAGRLGPGDRLPGIREMTGQWGCTRGTVHKAYQELAQQGLIVSRPGQGTHVAAAPARPTDAPLRWASLIHRAEAFLLEVLTAGYSPTDAEQAIRTALDRWRSLADRPAPRSDRLLCFVGSHDPAVALLAARFGEVLPGYGLEARFAGSLGGLVALARGEADLAGSHLWDRETDTYNAPFVRRLLPGRRVVLLTLAHRHLGLIVAPANPLGIAGLADLRAPGRRFVNRQRGSGTRVWLDAQLARLGIAGGAIVGYAEELATHGEVARAVAEGRADAALGVEAAARGTGLGFVPLTEERYDLVLLAEAWEQPAVQGLRAWLQSAAAREAIAGLGGYEVSATGQVEWLD